MKRRKREIFRVCVNDASGDYHPNTTYDTEDAAMAAAAVLRDFMVRMRERVTLVGGQGHAPRFVPAVRGVCTAREGAKVWIERHWPRTGDTFPVASWIYSERGGTSIMWRGERVPGWNKGE